MTTDPRTAPRRPSYSNPSGNCAEVSIDAHGHVMIRNDDGRPRPPGIATFTPAEWRAFIASVKAGEFGLDADGLLPAAVPS